MKVDFFFLPFSNPNGERAPFSLRLCEGSIKLAAIQEEAEIHCN